jgi:hypothetical protein
MPIFKVLYIEEFNSNILTDANEESDHHIAILYDESECNFYYYGTRARNTDRRKKYGEYSGYYAYDAFPNFQNFLQYLMDGENALITNELYEMYIDESEYSTLSFSKIKAKLHKSALLSAYDLQLNTSIYLSKILHMLITK